MVRRSRLSTSIVKLSNVKAKFFFIRSSKSWLRTSQFSRKFNLGHVDTRQNRSSLFVSSSTGIWKRHCTPRRSAVPHEGEIQYRFHHVEPSKLLPEPLFFSEFGTHDQPINRGHLRRKCKQPKVKIQSKTGEDDYKSNQDKEK